MNLLNFSRTRVALRSGLLFVLFSVFGAVQGQSDVIPSSADLRLIQGASNDQLLIQVKIHSTAGFGGILSALTVTIRYDAASGASLGAGSSFCNAWSSFTPSPLVVNDGIAYQSFNGFGINRLEDPTVDGGCGTQLLPEQWFTITTIPVIGGGCTVFTMGNDAYTELSNRDFYVSMGGYDVTGMVTSGPVNTGDCAFDCLGVSGGTALPGTACNDGDPNTTGDTWSANCECVGSACNLPLINGTTNNSPLCSGNLLQLGVLATGTPPLSYAWTGSGNFAPNANSQSVSVTGAVTGNYQVTVSNGCGSAQATVSVVVTTPPSATIAYPASPYCTTSFTDAVTRTGSAGGTYTASPAGLAFDANSGAIDPASSSAGNYTVTYSIAASGGCPVFSTTASLVITNPPSATIAYAGSPYCTSAGSVSVTRTGSTNGTYSATPSGLSINTNSGAINAGNSTPGTYTVTYSIAASGGCSAFSTTASVVIADAPSATITYTGSPFCTSAGSVNVTRTGSTNGTYTATPSGLSINANSGAVNAGTSTPGTYTVSYNIAASGGCSAFSTTASLEITDPPSATILYFGSPYCTILGNVTVNRTGSTNGTYSATPSGLVINANSGAVHVGNSTPGTYTVTYSIAASGGCAAFSTTAQVTIEATTSWYADSDGDGVGDYSIIMQACGQPVGYVATGGDLCPNDPNKVSPGVCGCGVPDTDTDLDGIPDCIDSCPTLSGEVGDPCDDGNAGTENDVITEDCICEGTIITKISEVGATNTDLVLYPNPNRTGTVNVELPGASVMGTVVIEVRDISGRILLQTIATPQGEQGRMTLELPRNMGAGNYTVQVIANGQRYVQRLVMY